MRALTRRATSACAPTSPPPIPLLIVPKPTPAGIAPFVAAASCSFVPSEQPAWPRPRAAQALRERPARCGPSSAAWTRGRRRSRAPRAPERPGTGPPAATLPVGWESECRAALSKFYEGSELESAVDELKALRGSSFTVLGPKPLAPRTALSEPGACASSCTQLDLTAHFASAHAQTAATPAGAGHSSGG